jgi:Fe-S cluster assembly protein SufB
MPEVKDRKKIENTLSEEYSAGFVTDVENETFEPGINEDVVTKLSKIKK